MAQAAESLERDDEELARSLEVCAAKITYTEIAQAHAACERTPRPLKIYLCEHCGMYHLTTTHNKKRARRHRRVKRGRAAIYYVPVFVPMNTIPDFLSATPEVNPEAQCAALDGVVALLRLINENPQRDGLQQTPERVVKALREMTRGYGEEPEQILSTTFSQDDEGVSVYGGMIGCHSIEFVSLCEHHMLPFEGKAHVFYIPNDDGRIVGLSKLARLVDCFARRLQVQERLTSQIADALQEHLKPRGVLVSIEATHSCMKLRGVSKQSATMVTTALRGLFYEDVAARAEALGYIKR